MAFRSCFLCVQIAGLVIRVRIALCLFDARMIEASRSYDDLCPLSLTDAQLVFQHAPLIILWDPLSQSKGLYICARSDSSSDTASYSDSISELIKAAVCISHFWIWFPHMQTSNLITHLPIGQQGHLGIQECVAPVLHRPVLILRKFPHSPSPLSSKAQIYCPCLF